MKKTIATTKLCTTCKTFHNLTFFYKDSYQSDGLTCSCKNCCNLKSIKIQRTKEGLLDKMFRSEVTRTKVTYYPDIEYSLGDFIKYGLNNLSFNTLYDLWVLSNYSKKLVPSADRLDDYKGYSFSNIQFITWEENNKKGKLSDKHKRKIQGIHCITKEVVKFDSIKEAQLTLKINNISQCCSFKRKSSGNYEWSYI